MMKRDKYGRWFAGDLLTKNSRRDERPHPERSRKQQRLRLLGNAYENVRARKLNTHQLEAEYPFRQPMRRRSYQPRCEQEKLCNLWQRYLISCLGMQWIDVLRRFQQRLPRKQSIQSLNVMKNLAICYWNRHQNLITYKNLQVSGFYLNQDNILQHKNITAPKRPKS